LLLHNGSQAQRDFWATSNKELVEIYN
jgi:hypothetical protein